MFASEGNVGDKMDEATLKAVTGQDKITARFMRAEFFSYRPSFSLFLSTNHAPKFLSQDEGLWRRVRLITFRRYFTKAERDPYLTRHIVEEEAEGVLAWAVQAAREWYDAGRRLPVSAGVDEQSNEYRADQDALRWFLDEHIARTADPRAALLVKAAYARYRAAHEEQADGTRQMTRSAFKDAMTERLRVGLAGGVDKDGRKRDSVPPRWHGFRLRTPEEVAELRFRAEAAAALDCEPADVEVDDGAVGRLARELRTIYPLQTEAFSYADKLKVVTDPREDTPMPAGSNPGRLFVSADEAAQIAQLRAQLGLTESAASRSQREQRRGSR